MTTTTPDLPTELTVGPIDTALCFSGGRDSRAILHMHREQLDRTFVLWIDTGAAYPEMRAEMERLVETLPHFLIFKADQPGQIARNGYPSDVVPIRYSPFGRAMVKSAEPFRVQSTFECCDANLWKPMQIAMKALGIKRLISGQRRAEQYTDARITNGTILNGIEYVLPIEDWTTDQVSQYLSDNGVELPAYYAAETSSRDCWDCTGYLSKSLERIKNLPDDKRTEVLRRLRYIDDAVQSEREAFLLAAG